MPNGNRVDSTEAGCPGGPFPSEAKTGSYSLGVKDGTWREWGRLGLLVDEREIAAGVLKVRRRFWARYRAVAPGAAVR